MTAADLLSAALNESFGSSAISFFADDDNYRGKFSRALNALFEDDNSNNDEGDSPERSGGKSDHRSAAQREADEQIAERFMHSLSDLLGGNEVLFDSSCQSLSIYDLTTPVSPQDRRNQRSEASDNTRKSLSCGGSSSVATDTTVSQTSRNTSSDSNDASKEFQSSIRNIMNSFSEIVSGGRAFTSDECDKVKREIVRLRQLRRRMSASDRFGVDFAGFSRSAHNPGRTELGKRRALNLEQQKRQLANIMAWDVEGWKQKVLLSNNRSGSDLSVDGFHDKKELREYIEQKYGMKQVSDLEKSRKLSKPRTSNCPVPLTRIDEDGIRSPTTPRARGRVTVRSLEQQRRSTSTPRAAQAKPVVDRSQSPSRRRKDAADICSSPSRHRQSTGSGNTKDGKAREMSSPSRHRHGSPSERSRRPTTPSERSRRALTPTDRSRRTTTPTDRSSRRAVTPSDRSARATMPTKDLATHGQCRSPSSRRGARTTAIDDSKTPAGRSRRSASPSLTTTPGRQKPKELDASKSKKRTQSPATTARAERSDATKRASKLPSVPNLSSHGSLDDDTTAMSSNRRKSTRHSSPARPERAADGSERRKRTEHQGKCNNGSSAKYADAAPGESPTASGCDPKERCLATLRRDSGPGKGRNSQHSSRSEGEAAQSHRSSRSTHLSSLTTHLARTTARRRGRSCARSVHSSRSASTTADRSTRSQRSSVRRSSIGASSRSQRLSRTLDVTAKSPAVDDSQHSRRSLNTRTSCRSRDAMASTEHSESRFDSSSTDTSAPKTPMRRSSAIETVASESTTIISPTVTTSTTDAGATTSTASTLAAGNGEATPRRRTVRHDLAEIIRGNTATTPTDVSSDSVASPPSVDSAAKQRHGIGKGSSHHPRSSIKMMLSPQRRTVRDFLKAQPASAPNNGLSVSSCHQTVG